MPNRAFWRALHSLAHPLSVGAVLLLLLNDHVLRVRWPSWWTGKIGDFAWLVFAPFIAAAIFAWLVPRRVRQHERVAGWLAFAGTGLWFGLGKTVPAVHALTVQVLDTLVGWHGTLGVDPSDILALPALLVGWRIWQHASNDPNQLVPRAWPVLGLGILATLATSYPPPNYGIYCLFERDSEIFAASGGPYHAEQLFKSTDGGFSWEEEPQPLARISECDLKPNRTIWYLSTGQEMYRFRPGVSIDRSDDNGQTWRWEIDLASISTEAHGIYHQRIPHPPTVQGMLDYRAGPLDAVISQPSGQLVVAMSHDGVLLRVADGTWNWVAVGPFSHVDSRQPGAIVQLLQYELVLALMLIILTPPMIIGKLHELDRRVATLHVIALVIWGLGLFLAFAAGPVRALNVLTLLSADTGGKVVIVGYALISLFISFYALAHVFRHKRSVLLPVLTRTFAIAFAFLLPYLLWTQGTVPNHQMAILFAMILIIATVPSSNQHFRDVLPSTSPPAK